MDRMSQRRLQGQRSQRQSYYPLRTIRRTIWKALLLILLVGSAFLGPPAWGQVKIAKILSATKINQHQNSHLVLIDFWATWCAPCISIGKQLEITQETFKEDLTIISLSNESEPVVQKFIDSHHPKLTIAIDAENHTFNVFGVNRFLPYSVLLNQKGEVLWRGHPANLSTKMISKFIERCQSLSGNPSDFITFAKDKAVPKDPAKLDQFSVELSRSQENYFIVSAEGVRFSGSCSKLFSEIMKISRHDIVVENDPLIQVDIGMHNWNIGPEVVLDKVLGELGLTREIRIEKTEYYWLTVTNPGLLWENTQITLGDHNGICLIGDESITVDNASVEEFSFRLSDMMDRPVYTGYESSTLHDWLVHYKYLDMTKEQLENEFGIRIELKTGTHRLHYFKCLVSE